MGYACPVCDYLQADAVHLANHLAFTALLRGGDHEQWLDDHVPEWESHGESWLAERVVDHAEETDRPDIPDSPDARAHQHREKRASDSRPEQAIEGARPDPAPESDEVQEVLRRARELTKERRRDESETE